jgi:hypothetical protein
MSGPGHVDIEDRKSVCSAGGQTLIVNCTAVVRHLLQNHETE